jgi:cyclin-dependent kinase 12/13
LSLDLIREIKFLSQLSAHSQFVSLQETFFSVTGDVFMAFEYMDADLAGVLQTPVLLNEAHVKCIMKQIVRPDHRCNRHLLTFNHTARCITCFAQQYDCCVCRFVSTHSVNQIESIMHRDCKASNLLLNRRGIVKLADFGLATNYRTRERFGCNVVTLWYRAPELLLGDERYGPAVDVWSAGVIFGELALRRHMFPGRSDQHQLQLIFEGCGVPDNVTWPGVTSLPNWRPCGRVQSQLRDLFSFALPADGIQLITELLSLNPAGRPSAGDALDRPYFHTNPMCEPHELPAFSPVHEYEARKARAVDAANGGAGAAAAATAAVTAAVAAASTTTVMAIAGAAAAAAPTNPNNDASAPTGQVKRARLH